MKSIYRLKVISQLGLSTGTPSKRPQVIRDRPGKSADAKTILVVDDEPSSLELAAIYLESDGFTVLPADSVAEGKKLLQSHTDIALVITDLKMPKEDGFALLQCLRDNLRFNHIPAIVFTSCSDHSYVIKAIELGAQEYIAKPFTAEVLLARVRRVLERCQKTLLLVSDYHSTILILTRALSVEGFTIVSATNGTEAVELITMSSVDIVITELSLDDMTGFDLMTKAQEVRPGFPFLFLGDPGIRVSQDAILAAGGCGLIDKPFNNLEVIRAVQRVRSQYTLG